MHDPEKCSFGRSTEPGVQAARETIVEATPRGSHASVGIVEWSNLTLGEQVFRSQVKSRLVTVWDVSKVRDFAMEDETRQSSTKWTEKDVYF
eukprot:5080502-Amphidinium_carterae.1